MLKYLESLQITLKNQKLGVEKHNTDWSGQAETPVIIQSKIVLITELQQDIETLKAQLSQKKKLARTMRKELKLFSDTIRNKAIGFHLAKPELLTDYDIKLRKKYETVPRPTTNHAISIKDTPSGKGFIVFTKSDPLADYYEWQKGIGIDSKDIYHIPPLEFLKSTTKSKFTDNEVENGIRYFYRVRACNRKGEGPWSSVVGRVQ